MNYKRVDFIIVLMAFYLLNIKFFNYFLKQYLFYIYIILDHTVVKLI